MLSFANPEWLALLLAVPLVVRLRLRHRLPALRFPNAAALGTPAIDFSKWFGAMGRGLVVAMLAVAVAEPRVPDLKTRLPSEGIAIAMVLDTSGSMATPDFAGAARLDAAKVAFAEFVDRRGNDAIALVTFAATPRTECPPSLNHSVVKSLLNGLEPRSGLDAGTNIGDAIAEALLRLQGSPARRKAIVLLSDGEHNATGTGADAPLTPRQAAQLAANLKVPLYAIDCGNPADASDAEAVAQRAAGQRLLTTSAELTGGRSFHVRDAEQLTSVLAEIDALERGPIESFQYRRYFKLSWIAVVAALACWMILTILEATLWRSLP